MNTHTEKTPGHRNQSVTNEFGHQQSEEQPDFPFVNSRSEAVQMRQFQVLANSGVQVQRLRSLQRTANSSSAKEQQPIQLARNSYNVWQSNYVKSYAQTPELLTQATINDPQGSYSIETGNFMEEVIIEDTRSTMSSMRPEFGIPKASKSDPDNIGFADMENSGEIYEIKSLNKADVAKNEAAHYASKANEGKATSLLMSGTVFKVGQEKPSGTIFVGEVPQSKFPKVAQHFFPLGANWFLQWKGHGAGAVTYEWLIKPIEPKATGGVAISSEGDGMDDSPAPTSQTITIEETDESQGQLDHVRSEINKILSKYSVTKVAFTSSTQVEDGSAIDITVDPQVVEALYEELHKSFGLSYCMTTSR